MKVFILGSCVTRDVFNYDHNSLFEVENYIARSSIGSIFSHAPFEDTYSHLLASPFQRRMVNADIEKTARHLIAHATPDLFILDLIDERFNLIQSKKNGGICTISAELRLKLNEEEKKGKTFDEYRTITSGTEEFIEIWQAGWNSLADILKKEEH